MKQIEMPPGGGTARALFAAIPRIKRARGWRLYTEGERRLVDLWQGGGAALFGHKPPALVRELKNAAERGLFASYPSHYEARLLRSLARLFPAKIARLYASRAGAEAAAARAGFTGTPPLWRPFSPIAPQIEKSAAFLPVLPFSAAPAALVLETGLASRLPPPPLPPLSPFLLAGAARAVCDILARPQRGAVSWPQISHAVRESGCWRREGIYIWREEGADNAARLMNDFERFLAAGFLIPPETESPLILPGELSPGEARALSTLLRETV
jgi:hypothetical protein